MLNIQHLFQQFSRTTALVIGDVMIDRYLIGDVARISPEAPVPVVRYTASENRLGGAANVALNVKALGAEVILCSVTGDDENGVLLHDLLPQHKLTTTGLVKDNSRQTTVKTRVMADNQHLLRVDREDTFSLSSAVSAQFMDNVRGILESQKIDVIILQDYNKGLLTEGIIVDMITCAKEKDIPVAVDPKKEHFFNYAGVALFKPNLKEINAQVPFSMAVNMPSLDKADKYIREKLKNDITLITLSEKGVYIANDSHSDIYPTHPRNIADVCGAGDTVISIAALAMAHGVALPDIARLSNLAGGQVCEKAGVVPVDKEQMSVEFSV